MSYWIVTSFVLGAVVGGNVVAFYPKVGVWLTKRAEDKAIKKAKELIAQAESQAQALAAAKALVAAAVPAMPTPPPNPLKQ